MPKVLRNAEKKAESPDRNVFLWCFISALACGRFDNKAAQRELARKRHLLTIAADDFLGHGHIFPAADENGGALILGFRDPVENRSVAV